MTPSKFEQTFPIPTHDFDLHSRMRPAAFFELAQELAMGGSTMIGVPDNVLGPRGLAWILLRMHVEYDRMPRLYEDVHFQTWHAGITGPLFIRDYKFLSTDGETLVRASSSWALMERETRSLARPGRISDILTAEPQHPDRAVSFNPDKVIWPEGAGPDLVLPRRVLYSDVDHLGHANNTRYAVWAYDALPPEVTFSRNLKSFSINYNRELRPSDTVTLRRVQTGPASWIVEGVHDEVQSFICMMEFDESL